MRGVALGAMAVAALGLIAAGLAGRDSDASACGDVGDRERTLAPSGAQVAFVRCTASGAAWLYIADVNGRRERLVVPRSYGCCYRPSESVVFREPSWSPDGRRLAVVIEDRGGTDVWTVDADTKAARRVTSGPARERAPRWSADGRAISFATETGSRIWRPASPSR